MTKDPSPGRRERACGRYMICAGAIPKIFTIRHARHIARTRGHGKVGLVVIAQPISEVDSLCTTCTFIAVLRDRPADMCVHAVHLHPLCRRYLWSQRSWEGRSSHVRLAYLWRGLDVKRMRGSGPLGRKEECATGAVHVIFVPVDLNNLTSISRTVAILCRIDAA